jgi:hypothetical protein
VCVGKVFAQDAAIPQHLLVCRCGHWHVFFIFASSLPSNFGSSMFPQSWVDGYIGKQGATVPNA